MYLDNLVVAVQGFGGVGRVDDAPEFGRERQERRETLPGVPERLAGDGDLVRPDSLPMNASRLSCAVSALAAV